MARHEEDDVEAASEQMNERSQCAQDRESGCQLAKGFEVRTLGSEK